MAGKYIENIACPNPKCLSSDALGVYLQEDGSYNGFCHKCEKFCANPYGDNEKPMPQYNTAPRKTVDWVLENSSISEIPDRKISKETCEKYGVRVAFDTSTREITTHYYPFYRDGQIIAFQEREVANKRFSMIGDAKNLPMFGQEVCGTDGKLLIVTEGMLDCLAAVEMFKTRGKNYRVCSLPNGANAKGVRNNYEWMQRFESIFLSLDQDGPGEKASEEICNILPIGKTSILHFSEKDPGDMWSEGKDAEYWQSFYSATKYQPDGIVSIDDVFEEAIKPVEIGLSWPWQTLTDSTYGIRRRELYGFGAGSGSGKTEGFKEIINHIIYEHNLPAGVLFLEEPVSKTVKVLAGKKLNKRFHVPDGDWTIDELVSGINDLRGRVYLYNHFGGKDWEAIKSKIRYMVAALGIKDIFVDHLTALVAQEDNEYKALNKIMEEMASLVEELDFTLYYISHLRKAGQGSPHEEGGKVHADQFKGSGAIVYWSHFLFGYERNQQAEDVDERNTTVFRVLKDRNTGLSTGLTFELFYDHKTGRWREKTDEDGLPEF